MKGIVMDASKQTVRSIATRDVVSTGASARLSMRCRTVEVGGRLAVNVGDAYASVEVQTHGEGCGFIWTVNRNFRCGNGGSGVRRAGYTQTTTS